LTQNRVHLGNLFVYHEIKNMIHNAVCGKSIIHNTACVSHLG